MDIIKPTMSTNRLLKREMELWLRRGPDKAMPEVLSLEPERRLINPLISFFCSREPLLKWHAVTAIGRLMAGLADRDMDSARIVMRRLMWSLNDESGGIGWGAPEAMGEIMAGHRRLADEFHAVLISYLDPRQNYLELEALQPGLLWGVGRLARSRRELMAKTADFLPPYLSSREPAVRGHAAWAAAAFEDERLRLLLTELAADDQPFYLYRNLRLEEVSIREIINL
ncbi:MAG: DVU0298 family protein [Thermodesulfobacteriota bacterium]